MNPIPLTRTTILAVLLCCGVLLSFAAEPSAPKPERDSGVRGERPAGEQSNLRGLIAFAGPYAAVFKDMTEEQKSAFREAIESVGQDAREIGEKLRATRKQLEEAIYSGKVDEAGMKKSASEIGELEGQMAVFRARVVAKVRPLLTSEQLERVEQARRELAERGFNRNREGGANPSQNGFDRPPGAYNGNQSNNDVRRPKRPASAE